MGLAVLPPRLVPDQQGSRLLREQCLANDRKPRAHGQLTEISSSLPSPTPDWRQIYAKLLEQGDGSK